MFQVCMPVWRKSNAAEIVAPHIDIQKTANPTQADAGDAITYTVTVTHLPDSTAPAFQVVITDPLNATNLTYVPGSASVTGSPGAAVTASPQYGVNGQTDVFAIGTNGQLHVSWVEGGGAWNGPVSLSPAPHIALAALQDSGGRFIEVNGADFTPNGKVTLAYDISSGGGPTTHQTGETTALADGAGAFSSRIQVNLTDISRAGVWANDVATNRGASGSL